MKTNILRKTGAETRKIHRPNSLVGKITIQNFKFYNNVEIIFFDCSRTELTGRRGRRRKQLLGNVKEKSRHCKLKEEALDRTLWRTGFGRDYGSVVRLLNE
jgi:hypothetical protein